MSATGLVAAADNGLATITGIAGSRLRPVLALVALLLGSTSCGDGGTTDPDPLPSFPERVSLSPETASLSAIGATVRLSAQVFDQNDNVMAGEPVSWASSDDAVATVDGSGLLTAVTNGTATVTATARAASGTATATVAQQASSLTDVTADIGSLPADARLLAADSLLITAPGVSVRLLPVGTDANGHALALGATAAWSSSDPGVATVDSTGLVTSVSAGRTVVTATSASASATSGGDGGRGAAVSASASRAQTTATMNVLVTDELAADRAALVALYEATNGPSWVNSDGWLTDAPVGEWHGVGVDAGGRVVGLELAGRWDSESRQWIRHGLEGPIPPELGNLSSLVFLDLDNNELTGPIPPELGNLSSLERLYLGRNALTGPIPAELGNLSRLVFLFIYDTGLTGPIPPELGNLSSLERLHLSSNALTGPIPPELGTLSSLETLYLRNNELTGPIPPELGNLSGLERLYLYSNALTGPIPPELGNLSSLEHLYLFNNVLTGPIPESFLGIRGLQYFYIAGNESLCVPNTAAFLAWLQAIQNRDSESVLCASG